MPLSYLMCGYASSNWMFSLSMVLMFAGLMVASVVFLVRSFSHEPEIGETAKDAKNAKVSERHEHDEVH